MRILYTNFHQADGGGHTTYVLSLVQALRAARHRGYRAGRQPPVSGSLGHAGRACRADGVQGRIALCLAPDPAHARVAEDRALRSGACERRGRSPALHAGEHGTAWRTSGDRLHATIRVPAAAWARGCQARLATDRVICVSEHTRRSLMNTPYAGCGLRTVKNGVDVDYFTPATPAQKALARERWLPPSQTGCAGGRQQRRHRCVQELA